MKDPSLTKEWFVTHDGQQFGPVALDDLKYEVESGALNPRLDMVWKEGLEDWIPSGDLEGLFNKDEKAEEEAKKKEDLEGKASEFIPEEKKDKRMLMKGKWGGTSRSAFIFFCYVFPLLWAAGIFFGWDFLSGKAGENILLAASAGMALVLIIICMVVLIRRFINLGMSWLWFLCLPVPVVNIWLFSRLITCPGGYAAHKKLDKMGWLLAILFWVPIIAVVLGAAFVAYTLTQSPPEDQYREMIENFIASVREKFTEIESPAESPAESPSDPNIEGN